MNGQFGLVTGAARGIGREIADSLARRGVSIAVVDVDADSAEKAAAEIREKGVKSIALKSDISSASEVKAIFEAVMKDFGRIDIVVNNAGITRDGLILRMKEEDWDAVINVNLRGTFLCCREAIKIMSKQRHGRIVNVSSVVAFMGNAGQANYSASKAGMIGLTKTLAKEYASRGITVNAVAPGFITTAMTDALPDQVKQDMLKAIPMNRFGTVEDVANAVVFLASAEAAYITGQVIHINGGLYM